MKEEQIKEKKKKQIIEREKRKGWRGKISK